jgi:hypothetical protein
MLTVTTTHLKENYSRNGVPRSANLFVEHWAACTHGHARGRRPVLLTEPRSSAARLGF